MARVRQVRSINWSSCCLGLEVLCVIAFLQSIDAAAGRLNLQLSELNWWDARSKCREDFMSDLFIPEYEPTGITLTPGEDYWLGVTRYSTWKWTQDFTDLYRYIGYNSIPDDSGPPFTLDENSVYECNRKCTDYQLFGLSGTKCYCLEKESQVSTVQSASEEQCTGNLDEKCGNASGMSIYKLDHVVFDLQSTRRCSYAQKREGVEPSITVTAAQCSHEYEHVCFREGPPATCGYYFPGYKRYCQGNVCISCYTRTWSEKEDDCQRLKINASTYNDLLNVAHEGTEYWIGLYRFRMEAWVNGTSVKCDECSRFRDYDCLSVRLEDGKYTQWWSSCFDRHKAICDVIPVSPTVSTTLATTLETRPSTISDTSSERSVSEANGDQEMKNSNDKLTGVYVGACIGGVLFLTLTLILLVVLKRQRRLCFRNESPEQGSQAVTFNYNVPADHKKGNQKVTYTSNSVPVIDEKRKRENLKAVKSDTANESVTLRNNNRSRNQSPQAREAQVHQLVGSVEDVDDGYYNISGHNAAEDNGIYHLAEGDDIGLHNLASPAQCMDDPVDSDPIQAEIKENEYDALGQQVSVHVYDRIG